MTLNEVLAKHDVPHPRCGAGVGDGWVPLVDRLITRLIELGWDRNCAQIKEKFGGLRFYIGAGEPEIRDAIRAAEDESFRTCEDCGEPGEPRRTGWYKTRCDGCATGAK